MEISTYNCVSTSQGCRAESGGGPGGTAGLGEDCSTLPCDTGLICQADICHPDCTPTCSEGQQCVDTTDCTVGLECISNTCQTTTVLSDCGYTGWAVGEYYTLSGPVSSSSPCFTINANQVTLDCLGHTITQTGNFNTAVKVQGDQVIIRNCNISSQMIAVDVSGSNGKIEDSALSSSGTKVVIISGSGNTIEDNEIILSNTSGAIKRAISITDSDNSILRNTVTVIDATAQNFYASVAATSLTVQGNDFCGSSTFGSVTIYGTATGDFAGSANRCSPGACYEDSTSVVCSASGSNSNCELDCDGNPT